MKESNLEIENFKQYKDWRDPELNARYGLASLLSKYYKAKHAYYGKGKSTMTDEMFDALEHNINVIYGDKVLPKYGCVGYDADKHKIVKDAEYFYRNQFMNLFNER